MFCVRCRGVCCAIVCAPLFFKACSRPTPPHPTPNARAARAPHIDGRYGDLGGMEALVPLVRQLVELPLRHPELYAHVGVDTPRGLLVPVVKNVEQLSIIEIAKVAHPPSLIGGGLGGGGAFLFF